MRLSIKYKSIAAISVLMMVLAFSLMAMSVYYGSRSVRDELLRRGDISVSNLAYNATYATLIGDTATISDLLGGIIAEREVLYARIIEPNGATLGTRERPGVESDPNDGRGRPVFGSVDSLDLTTTVRAPLGNEVHFQAPIFIRQQAQEDFGAEYGLYDLPVTLGPKSTTYRRIIGYAQIGMTTRYIELTISNMRSSMFWITILIVLVAMLATSMFVRMAIRPINALVAATGRVASGDYDCKVEGTRNDEIGDLATSFNQMTGDLKSSRAALVEKDLLEAAIVELKETQQQLVQAGKMAAIGQLAAGVAHEINNPLAGIMGYAQLASEQLRSRGEAGLKGPDLAKFQTYVENMEKQSQRCKQIVQNLLRFARASSKEETEPLDVNEILLETLSFVSHQMTSLQIEVEPRLQASLPAIQGHAGKLQQVFTNLLINAVQAIGEAGQIVVETATVGGSVAVYIRDSGEGIPEENLDKIFEPFFTTKEIGQGTGLGLSVTYGLVQNMGGRIEVESQIGRGTTFTLKFPISRATSPGREATDPQWSVGMAKVTVAGSPDA